MRFVPLRRPMALCFGLMLGLACGGRPDLAVMAEEPGATPTPPAASPMQQRLLDRLARGLLGAGEADLVQPPPVAAQVVTTKLPPGGVPRPPADPTGPGTPGSPRTSPATAMTRVDPSHPATPTVPFRLVATIAAPKVPSVAAPKVSAPVVAAPVGAPSVGKPLPAAAVVSPRAPSCGHPGDCVGTVAKPGAVR